MVKRVDRVAPDKCQKIIDNAIEDLELAPEFVSDVTRFYWVTLPNGNLAQVVININRNTGEWINPSEYEGF